MEEEIQTESLEKGLNNDDKIRFREIVSVFWKHHMISNFVRMKHPAEFCEGLEELGPTFIKIGQMLSVRSDMVSPEYVTELEKLQGNTKSDPWHIIEPVLESNLGCPVDEVFSVIEKDPFASASIAQVHHATMKDGNEEVVVKIQHPGIQDIMERDFSLIRRAIPLAEKTPFAKNINFRELVSEFHSSIREELDFKNEAKNTEQFYQNNHGEWGIFSPQIVSKWTTQELLIQTAMHGSELSAYLEKTNEAAVSGDEAEKSRRIRIADRLINNYFKQVFDDAFFHADPHPGNIMIELAKEGESFDVSQPPKQMSLGPVEVSYTKKEASGPLTEKVIWIDFGMMGKLDKGLQKKLKQLIITVFGQNTHEISQAILDLCPAGEILDEDDFEQQVGQLFRKYYTLSMGNINISNLLEDGVVLCRTYHLKLPESLVLLARGISTLQGIVETLNPNLSVMDAIQPYVARFMLEDFSAKDVAKEYGMMGWLLLNNFPKVPEKCYSLLEQMEEGRLKIQKEESKSLKQQRFEEKQLYRILLTFLSGTLFITGAILELAETTAPKVTGNVCFVLGTLLIVLLLWGYFRGKGKRKK